VGLRKELGKLVNAVRIWRVGSRTLDLDARPLVMGILNVTPDSFSDGGKYLDANAAVARGLEMIQEGADILDLGGESSRPGAEAVSAEEECRRVVPVVRELARRSGVLISVDTVKPQVAREALAGGAHIINDITALGDPEMVEVVRSTGAGAILMHMQGTPATMQKAPSYTNVVAEVKDFLLSRLLHLRREGIAEEQFVLDPGIGFGKAVEHNLELLRRLPELQSSGRPVCLGVSRKSIFGKVLGRAMGQRLAGSLAAVAHALGQQSAQVVRVHDVAATRDVVEWYQTMK
jgi:dihydropteroate synthase